MKSTNTTIQVSHETMAQMKQMFRKGETYDDGINRMLKDLGLPKEESPFFWYDKNGNKIA